jgi:hypothetical protein
MMGLLLVAATSAGAATLAVPAGGGSCGHGRIRDGKRCISLPHHGGRLPAANTADASLNQALLEDGPSATTQKAVARVFGTRAARKWEQALSTAEGVSAAAALPWVASNPAGSPGAGRIPVHVGASGGLRSVVSTHLSKLDPVAGGYQRSQTTTATLSANGLPGARIAQAAGGPHIQQIDKLMQAVWPCPGTGPHPKSGEAQAKEIGTVQDTFALPIDPRRRRYATQKYRWELSLTVYAHADNDANLHSFQWKWELTSSLGGNMSASYTSVAPGAPVPAAPVTRSGQDASFVEAEVVAAVDNWAYDEANLWAKDAFATWNPKHACTSLEMSKPRHDLVPGISINETIDAAKNKLGHVIEQKITPDAPAGVSVTPSSAEATPGHPARFTVLNTSTDEADLRHGPHATAYRRGRDAAAGGLDVQFDGVSDDGESVLDLPIDTQPPIATVQSYAVQQTNTGAGPGTSGQQTISETLADHSAQAFPAFCEDSECRLSLWIDDAVTSSGSAHRAADANNPSCDVSSGPTSVDVTDIGVTNVYLDYDADGDLSAAHLEQAPYAPSVGDPNNGGDECDTNLSDNIPQPDWVEQPLDLAALGNGTSILENFTRSGTFDLGEAGSISYNWQSQLGFSIANAGTPARS